MAAIKRYLATLGETCSSGRNTAAPYGFPACRISSAATRDGFWGLEAKLSGRLTPLQKRALERINRAGGLARRVESVDDVKGRH